MTSGPGVMGGAVGVGEGLIGMVLLPITTHDPDVGRRTGMLLTVAVPPGVRVLMPPIISAEPEVGREIGVLSTVMTPPGVKGWPCMTSGPGVVGGRAGTGDGSSGMVLLPITIEDPDVGK